MKKQYKFEKWFINSFNKLLHELDTDLLNDIKNELYELYELNEIEKFNKINYLSKKIIFKNDCLSWNTTIEKSDIISNMWELDISFQYPKKYIVEYKWKNVWIIQYNVINTWQPWNY